MVSGQGTAGRHFPAGISFEIALIARNPATAKDDLDAVGTDLREGLREWGLGAKTAAGYGVFEIVEGDQPGQRATVPASPPSPKPSAIPQRTPFEDRLALITAIPQKGRWPELWAIVDPKGY